MEQSYPNRIVLVLGASTNIFIGRKKKEAFIRQQVSQKIVVLFLI